MIDLEKRALLAIEKLRARVRELEGAGGGYAIVGYAVRFPGAADSDEFWDVLDAGAERGFRGTRGPVGCRGVLRRRSRRRGKDGDPAGRVH